MPGRILLSVCNLLTEVELEFMNELWALGEGTVRDVLARLPEDRALAYTSAATILRILEQKEFVTSRKSGKSHVYRPTLAKDAYQSRVVKDLSAKLFDDTPASLVARLVDDAKLLADGKTVYLEIEDFRPAHQMKISFNINAVMSCWFPWQLQGRPRSSRVDIRLPAPLLLPATL